MNSEQSVSDLRLEQGASRLQPRAIAYRVANLPVYDMHKHCHAPVVRFYIKVSGSSTRAYKAVRNQTGEKPS